MTFLLFYHFSKNFLKVTKEKYISNFSLQKRGKYVDSEKYIVNFAPMNITRTWIPAHEIRPQDSNLKIRQVYCWITTNDGKIIIVSKDGMKWQFPGGKPDEWETIEETLIREVYEETGLEIENAIDNAELFGYYKIVEWNEGYLQLRYKLQIDQPSDKLELFPHEREADTDKIEYVIPCSQEELTKKISWLRDSEELRSFLEA